MAQGNREQVTASRDSNVLQVARPNSRGHCGTDEPAPAQGSDVGLLVLGIMSVVIPLAGFLCGIVAIILSRRKLRRAPNGFATAGLVLGIIGTAIHGLLIFAPLILFAADVLIVKFLRILGATP